MSCLTVFIGYPFGRRGRFAYTITAEAGVGDKQLNHPMFATLYSYSDGCWVLD